MWLSIEGKPMKKILIAAALMLTVAAFGATKDDFAGFYKGEVLDKIPYPFGAEREIFAEVYRGPNQTYRVKFVQDIFRRAEEHAVFDGLKAKDGKITVKGGQGMTFKDVDCEITPEEITATFKAGNKKAKMHLKRLNYVSPTMGKKPLEGAVVLFDGKDTSQWTLQDGSPCNWEIKDGAMLVKTDAKDAKGKRKNSSIVSKEKFGHCYLHLEFKVPAMYENLGQARANSGVIFFNKYYYEIQILDSFGTPAFWNECGSLYRQVPPQMNASLEPETWQTYDIEYVPAKFSGDRIIDNPRFTVYLNGVRVQEMTPLSWPTNYGPTKAGGKNAYKDFSKDPMPIMLQDHGNPVMFRNIWVKKLD